jgi:probable HAF family extracellular repeat protein
MSQTIGNLFRSFSKVRIVFMAGVVLLWGGERMHAAPTFTALGVFGGVQSRAHDVSADGSVVVGTTASLPGPSISVFRWSGAGSTQRPVTVGNPELQSAAVSADASTTVGTHRSANGDEAFRWTVQGLFEGVGDLPGGTFHSEAFGVSADGRVIVGSSQSAAGVRAFRWTEGAGMSELGGNAVVARDVSADGMVVVGLGSTDAFRWTAGTGSVAIIALPGANSSGAYAASADGSVVVGYNNFPTGLSGSRSEAFRWTQQGGTVSLQTSPWTYSVAVGVSGDGSAIVGGGNMRIPGGSDTAAAFYWSAETGMVSVQDLLISLGVTNFDGWLLTSAEGISEDGLTLAGWGFHNGRQEGWVATIPEPHTILLAALAAAGMLLAVLLRAWPKNCPLTHYM